MKKYYIFILTIGMANMIYSSIPSKVTRCTTCHQSNLKGLPGVYPPIIGDSEVLKDNHAIAYIIIHGLNTGKGISCPSFSHFTANEIIEIAKYVGGANGNNEEIFFSDISRIKAMSDGTSPNTKSQVIEAIEDFKNTDSDTKVENLDSKKIEEQEQRELEKNRENPVYGNVMIQKDGSLKVVLFPQPPYENGMDAEVIIIKKEDTNYRKLLKFISPISPTNNHLIYEVPSFLK